MRASIDADKPNPIELVIDSLRDALINCFCETGHAHFEIETALISKAKNIARVRLLLGTTYSFTVARKDVQARPASRFKKQWTTPLEPVLNLVRKALIDCLLQTGQGHFEINCAVIDKQNDVVRVQVKLGTTYSYIIRRKDVSATTAFRVPRHTAELVGPQTRRY
jgi:hypothetical protein